MVALEGSSTVVTAADDGEVVVWNMDSCAPKRRLLAPGTALRPANERAVEALAFLHLPAQGGGGRGRVALVAVGADRWLRLWDVLDGALLAARFTGHRQARATGAGARAGLGMWALERPAAWPARAPAAGALSGRAAAARVVRRVGAGVARRARRCRRWRWTAAGGASWPRATAAACSRCWGGGGGGGGRGGCTTREGRGVGGDPGT
jgi:hypothetical protein